MPQCTTLQLCPKLCRAGVNFNDKLKCPYNHKW